MHRRAGRQVHGDFWMNFNNLSDVIFRRRCENLKKNLLHTSLDCMGRVKATHWLLGRVCGNLEKVHSLCEEGSILSYSHNGPSKNDCNTSIFYARYIQAYVLLLCSAGALPIRLDRLKIRKIRSEVDRQLCNTAGPEACSIVTHDTECSFSHFCLTLSKTFQSSVQAKQI